MSRSEPRIIGISAAMRRLVTLAQRFATSGLSVLLIGETGTGKELFAESIHRWSGRGGELVDVNCGALPSEMAESLLFGHRRGAFTGATESVEGFVASADRGTLFLDEVTSLSSEAQAKLLRVLEAGEVRPLGGNRKRSVDLRVVAAAQVDLWERVEQGAFRLDLYQRLAGIVLAVPPLRERPEDLAPLASHFAEHAGRELSTEAVRLILNQSWRGNGRELRLAVERAGWLTRDEEITAAAMEESLRLGASAAAAEPRSGERERLVRLCDEVGWDIGRASEVLGVSRSTFYKRLAELQISVRAARRSGASETVSDGPRREGGGRQVLRSQVQVV